MKLKKELVLSTLGDSYVLVSADTSQEAFHGVVKLNKTGAFIAECLKENTDEETLLEKLKERFDGSEEQMRRDIRRVIETFSELDILEDAD